MSTNGTYRDPVPVAGEQRARESFTMAGIFRSVHSNWLLYLTSIIFLIAAAFFYIRYTTPKYRAHAKILVKDSKKGGEIAGSGIFQELDLLSDHNSTDNEVELLKSRTLLEKTVDELDLHVRYFTEGTIKTKEAYHHKLPLSLQIFNLNTDSLPDEKISIEKVNSSQIRLEIDGSEPVTCNYGDTVSTVFGRLLFTENPEHADFKYWPIVIRVIKPDAAAANLREVISISPTSKTVSTIDLTISDPIPDRAEDILNMLLFIYDRMNKDDKNRIADSTIAFIDERLQIVANELGSVETDIETFRKSNDLTDLSSQSKLLLDNSFEYVKELTQHDVQIEVVKSLENYLADNNNSDRLVPTSLTIQDPTLIALVQAYNAAQIEMDRRAQNTAPNNPVMKQLSVQVKNLKGDILATLGNIKKGLTISRNSIKQKTDQMSSQMRAVPKNEKLFLEYSRQQSIKQELYLYLLKKREETSVSKAANVDMIRLVDAGKSEDKPYYPKPQLIYFLAVILGFVLPGIGLFIADVLNTKISDKSDITSKTATQVLAEILHNDGNNHLVVEPGTRTVIAEQFRTLRTNLQYVLPGADEKCIMITSSMSAEGKSFVAMNLASAIVLTGKKVVLLELDLRKPKISKALDIDQSMGFTNYIINKCDIEDIIIPSDISPHLYVVPSGAVPPNPSELLLLPKVKEFFDYLKINFDYIIIDTAPVGLVSDALLLAKYADTSLFIVRHRYTFKQQVAQIEDLRVRKKLPRLNIVINDIRVPRNLAYGYGYTSYGNEEYFEQSRKQKKPGRKSSV